MNPGTSSCVPCPDNTNIEVYGNVDLDLSDLVAQDHAELLKQGIIKSELARDGGGYKF